MTTTTLVDDRLQHGNDIEEVMLTTVHDPLAVTTTFAFAAPVITTSARSTSTEGEERSTTTNTTGGTTTTMTLPTAVVSLPPLDSNNNTDTTSSSLSSSSETEIDTTTVVVVDPPTDELPPLTEESYTRKDMKIFNLLDHPIWIFDIVDQTMYWGNTCAIEYWNAKSLEELIHRNFKDDMSDAVHKKNLDTLERLKRNECVEESVTYYPNGSTAKTMKLKMCGIYINYNDDDSHAAAKLCLLCEAFPLEDIAQQINPNYVRCAVTLQYLPLSVRQFQENGTLTYQNPEACHIFGTPGNKKKKRKTALPTDGEKCSTTTRIKDDDETKGNDCNVHDVDPLESLEKSSAHNSDGGSVDDGYSDDNDSMVSTDTNHFVDIFVDQQKGQEILDEIKSGKDVSVEALVHTKHGIEWNAIHARLGKDAITADPIILFSARNISDLIEAKKEIQLNKERAEFFAIMAHEIRTPLFQVTGFIDLLDQTTLTCEQKGCVQQLKASANGLMTVINDVLDYSKLEAGKMKLDILPFEPKAVVDGVLAAVAVTVEEKGLALTNSFPSCGIPVKVMGDPNRLRQILLNLLSNAIKFTHSGGIHVTVEVIETKKAKMLQSTAITNDDCSSSLENDGTDNSEPGCDDGEDESVITLKFGVEDTGIGLDSQNLSNIFRKYNQAAPAISTKYGGTGLGLSICQQLVQVCMKGKIGVNSIKGKGSTFWFEVPFQRVKGISTTATTCESSTSDSVVSSCAKSNGGSDASANRDQGVNGKRKRSLTPPPTSRSLRILVAEDNGVNQKLIMKMLTRLGHHATIVENGKEAVDAIQKSKYGQRQDDPQAESSSNNDSSSSVHPHRCDYDLILMDMQMPVMDGIDATKEIRSLGYNSDTLPIVGLTASVRRSDFVGIGLNDWIGKPVRLNELQKKITEICA